MPPPDRTREAALMALRRVEEGMRPDEIIETARLSLDARDRAFLLELVYGTLRNRLLIDWFLDRFSVRPVARTDTWTRNILRLGAYQLLFLDRVPPSAAVNTSVDLAKQHGRKAGYVNGLLRSLERERGSLTLPDAQDPVRRLSLRYSHPEWLVRRWVERFGPGKAAEILKQSNLPAPLVIRANTAVVSVGELTASLEAEGAVVRPGRLAPAALDILSTPGITTHRAYREGWFMVQDEAAQLVTLILAPAPGDRVLDACAAPGGKAAHCAELMANRGSVLALEVEERRIPRLSDNLARLKHSIVRPVVADAATFRGGPFDKVLIDAPCSGLGVLRRHPDGRWNKTEASLADRAALQGRILRNCAELLVPAGVLVYATCSTEPEETDAVIDAFLAECRGRFVIADAQQHLPVAAHGMVDRRGLFRTWPNEPGLDGFFAARLERLA